MEIYRKSHVADAVLLEFAGKEITYLDNDLPRFTAYDKDLNKEKHDSLRTTYRAALTFGSDTIEVGILEGLTQKVTTEFDNCVNIFKDVRYFARKAFGKNRAVLTEFGFEKYKHVRRNQLEMVLFMYQLGNTAEKYKTQLLAAGLKETVINGIATAAEALGQSNIDQETDKTGRTSKTEGRIMLLNSLYDILLEFSEAAKIIFAKDPLTRSKYILPYSTGLNGGDTPPAPPAN